MHTRQLLRKEIRQRRNALSNTEQIASEIKLSQRLSQHPKVLKAKHIALYLSNDGELSTSHFIQWCWKNDKSVYLPVIHPFSKGQLLFLAYQQETPLVANAYGILEPKLNVTTVCPLTRLDIIFTPLVAFDTTGARLGMGGGFYDRSLANWQKGAMFPIGLAHDCQQVESVPIESWDIPLPEIITPSEAHCFIK